MQSKSHPKYECKDIIPSRELGVKEDLWLGWFSVARTAFFFLISDIKLEALRSQVASGGAHISLFGCLMLVLQKAVVGGPSTFSLTLIGSCLVSSEWY